MATRRAERLLADLAGRQHGVVSARQLYRLGFTGDQVTHRVQAGRLQRIHRGVYAVGHGDVALAGRWRAATLATTEAVLSHRSAAELWGMADPRPGPIHITLPRKCAKRPGLYPHRARHLPDERTIRDGIPVTTVARTLLDLATAEGRRPLERALREAHFRRLPGRVALHTLVARYPGRRGTAIVASALEAGTYAKRTRSELEARFLDFCAGRGLELPETNAIVAVAGRRYEVDCLWQAERLIVELDGRSAHLIPEQVETDLERDGLLQADGFAVHRVSPHRLEADGDGLEAQLRAALSLPRAA